MEATSNTLAVKPLMEARDAIFTVLSLAVFFFSFMVSLKQCHLVATLYAFVLTRYGQNRIVDYSRIVFPNPDSNLVNRIMRKFISSPNLLRLEACRIRILFADWNTMLGSSAKGVDSGSVRITYLCVS